MSRRKFNGKALDNETYKVNIRIKYGEGVIFDNTKVAVRDTWFEELIGEPYNKFIKDKYIQDLFQDFQQFWCATPGSVGIRPDAVLIDLQAKEILFMEVEDTSVMSQEKYDVYLQMAMADWLQYHDFPPGEDWFLRLVVFDRYGLNPIEHPLYEIAEQREFELEFMHQDLISLYQETKLGMQDAEGVQS